MAKLLVKSITKTTPAKMIEATITMIVLLCNSSQVGHDTFVINSSEVLLR